MKDSPRSRNKLDLSVVDKMIVTSPFVDRYKPQGSRREQDFVSQLRKLMIEVLDLGYEEGVSTKADFGARRLGKRGGLKGGVRRAKALSPERRSQIARDAANKRWHPEPTGETK